MFFIIMIIFFLFSSRRSFSVSLAFASFIIYINKYTKQHVLSRLEACKFMVRNFELAERMFMRAVCEGRDVDDGGVMGECLRPPFAYSEITWHCFCSTNEMQNNFYDNFLPPSQDSSSFSSVCCVEENKKNNVNHFPSFSVSLFPRLINCDFTPLVSLSGDDEAICILQKLGGNKMFFSASNKKAANTQAQS